jgi:hypothetical protein
MREKTEPQQTSEKPREKQLPKYEPPKVITYRGKEIMERLGPAQACSFNNSVLICV